MADDDAIAEVITAHQAVKDAEAAVTAAVQRRAAALRDAHAKGHRWAELGAALGVGRARAQAASRQGGTPTLTA